MNILCLILTCVLCLVSFFLMMLMKDADRKMLFIVGNMFLVAAFVMGFVEYRSWPDDV